MAGYVEGQEMAGYVEGQEMAGYVEGQEMAGYVEGQEMAGYVEGQQMAGYVEGQEMAGYVAMLRDNRWLAIGSRLGFQKGGCGGCCAGKLLEFRNAGEKVSPASAFLRYVTTFSQATRFFLA